MTRIKELAEQAVVEVKNLSGTEYVFSKEKFAELIIRECSDIAIENGCGDFVDINQLLLKHFGVEK
jgi:hypothetical protein